MLTGLARRVQPQRAAAALVSVFGGIAAPFAFRLWDGREVTVGDGAAPFTVVINSPETFLRLLRSPTPLTFAEAYVESALDIEGDLFAVMIVADIVEGLRLSLPRRLALLASLWKP
jgi:hypothetical protein